LWENRCQVLLDPPAHRLAVLTGDGRYIFISGPGYGWKQWVSDGCYTALGLDDPEKTIESNRAVFGKKLLTDKQVLTHVRTSEKVKTPYGLPAAEVDALLVERIAREIAYAPAFNESISTVTGKPHGHILYSWNSGYWRLRREIRKRLGQTGPDPVNAAIDRRFAVIREDGRLRLEPARTAEPPSPERLIGYAELQTDLPGGRHANIRTMRAVVVQGDGSGRRVLAKSLVQEPDTWTQFAGWSPGGQWLGCGSKREGVRQLYVMRLADRLERRLTDLKRGQAAMWLQWQPTSGDAR